MKRATFTKIDHCNLNIYYDQDIIEIYINNGQYVLSNIVYEMADTIKSNTGLKSLLTRTCLNRFF
ncbi:MAG: GH32 C-terminal domain-containing protein [Streptococcus sp.]